MGCVWMKIQKNRILETCVYFELFAGYNDERNTNFLSTNMLKPQNVTCLVSVSVKEMFAQRKMRQIEMKYRNQNTRCNQFFFMLSVNKVNVVSQKHIDYVVLPFYCSCT